MKYFKRSFRYLIFLLPAILQASPVQLSWTDNSDNETGFVVKGRLEDGTWEKVAETPANTTEVAIESDTHAAWQVFAFNEWGQSGGTNVLGKGSVPQTPNELKNKLTVTVTVEVK